MTQTQTQTREADSQRAIPAAVPTGYPVPQPQAAKTVNRSLTAAPVCGKRMADNGTEYRTCLKPAGHDGQHRRYPPAPRRKRQKDNGEYFAMMRRLLRSASLRLELEDPTELTVLIGLRADLDAAIDSAARAFHTSNGGDFSWGEIGRQTGMTRQAAFQRWGSKTG
jgi:hypothetical protein